MTLKSATKRAGRREQARVQIAVNAYCLRTYGVGYTGGVPRRLTLPSGSVWIIPVVLTSAGYGHVGEVGMVAIDPATLDLLDATAKTEVRAAGARLAREKRDALDTAFRRARTT